MGSPLQPFLAPVQGASTSGLAPVDAILDAVRDHLGLEIAFASRFVDGRREFTHIRSTVPIPASPGDSEPLEDTFCHRILEGRLPQLIHDAQAHEAALDMVLTRALPIGAHLNVPLRLSDGTVYGTFCCLSRQADHSLTTRDLNTLKAFADLAAQQIERDMTAHRRSAVIRQRIEHVLDKERIGIVYQPIHRLADGRPVGVESLSRFPDSDDEWGSPSDWFAAASEVGLGEELELLAIRRAIAGLGYIPAHLYLSLNLSPETAVSGRIEPLLKGLPAGRIVVELTEHSQVGDYGRLAEALARLRGLARVAIDDVGAGYAGLRHIVDLKPDLLKLDIELTRQIDSDEARRALGHALASFARRTGSRIIAEGVETATEAASLRSIGIRYAQGFLFSRPMPAVGVQHYLLGARHPRPAAARSVRRASAR